MFVFLIYAQKKEIDVSLNEWCEIGSGIQGTV